MSEAVVTESAPAPSPKKKIARRKSPKTKPNHPKISQMINAAIVELKDRGGSSLQAIKKYIASTYQVDVEKLAPFIKKHLKLAVSDGSLIQTKGKGASGSFKISVSGKKSEAKHAPKIKIVAKKVVKPKPKLEKSKRVVKPKTKVAAKVKKVSKVKAKKNPVKAKAPKPKKAMKKGSKSSKKAPKQSKTV